MSASILATRRRLVIVLAVLALVVAAVVATMMLRPDADLAAGVRPSSSATASAGKGAEVTPEETDPGMDGGERDDGPSEATAGTGAGSGSRVDDGVEPQPRETLEPRPYAAVATPEPGVTVQVPSVEKVTGEANVPGEVGGPALRFTVELTNGTGKTLDLRTVVVNAYYGPDRTPAAPLLKPGGRAFEAEAGVEDSARGVFVFNIPSEFQDEVELEVDAGIGKAIAIFTGA